MDLEKAYNKIDNLCCFNHNESKYWQDEYGQWVDFFQGYAQTKDEDFCKDENEMVEALDTIKNLVDTQKEFGCPLDIVLKIKFGDIHYVYDENGNRFFINGGEIFKSQFAAYRRTDTEFIDKVFKWSDYGKTWWLKEDRSM